MAPLAQLTITQTSVVALHCSNTTLMLGHAAFCCTQTIALRPLQNQVSKANNMEELMSLSKQQFNGHHASIYPSTPFGRSW